MIPITRPFLDEKEAKAAHDAVLSGWVTQGPKTMEFEQAFSKYTGAKFSCAVSNCTVALHVALLAVGVMPGDVVITVSHSFIATANAIRYCGAEPVFVDIELKTYNMDVDKLEECLREDCEMHEGILFYKHIDSLAIGVSPLSFIKSFPSSERAGRVAAILAVHQMGTPCDILEITKIAKKFGIAVVEDAACAIGSEIENGDWEKIGKPHGDIACFSFHPRKIITSGEGGMLTTNSSEYDNKFRLLRQHGMSIPDTARHSSKNVVFEDYVLTGFNYRMTDIQAAIGIEQVKKLNGIVEERRNLAKVYAELLSDVPFLCIPKSLSGIKSNWQSYPVRITANSPFDQVPFMQKLLDNGISSRRGIMNAHQEIPYKEQKWSLPKSEEARNSVVLLPFYNGMTHEELDRVVRTIKEL
ncbi:MAG: DegT/DnrJ/EryC1/StrS family aminotransferase [Proteobacteria bacterium]|nr:DegT/DnrJ/EryC1/StrS family aminotransferase [Pseudomonadota bacterium]